MEADPTFLPKKRGRPKGSTRPRRLRTMISFPVTPPEAEAIELEASARGVTRAQLIRDAIKYAVARHWAGEPGA